MATEAIKCKYFPLLPARWYCAQCKVNMANECARTLDSHRPENLTCPICSKPLQSIGIANSIKPFWERIPKFFAYPAKTDNLIYISVLSVLLFIGLYIPVFILNICIPILVFFGLLRYASNCLYLSAQGNLTPPVVLGHNNYSSNNIPVKLCGLFVFIMFVIVNAFRANVALGFTVQAFSLLSIPAMTILLAITERFFEAINPLKVIKIMFGMGKSYLLLFLFLMSMYGSSQLLEYWAANYVSQYILFPIIFFINAYFTIAMFSMMGYAIYQYHEEFGFEGVSEANLAEEGVNIKASGISQDSFLNEIHILVSEGMLDEACKRLKKQIRETYAKPEHHEKYHALLKLTKNTEDMKAHTTDYIRLMLGQPKVNKGQIIAIYADTIKMSPDYFFPDAKTTVDLAKTAQDLFKNEDALTILANFAEHYPNTKQIPQAYFTKAQILVDYKQDDAQARKILLSLKQKYPEHELSPQIDNYLSIIDKIAK